MNRPFPYGKTFALLTLSLGTVWSAGPRLDGNLLSITRSAAAAGVQDGLFTKEELTEEKALKMTIDLYGPISPAIVPVLNDLASLQRYSGQYDEALANSKWGLAIREKNFGPNDPLVAGSLDFLAGTEVDLGLYHEAEEHYQRALKLETKDPYAAASTQLKLGNLYLLMDRPDDALPLFKRSLAALQQETTDDLISVPALEGLAAASAAKDPASAEKDLQQVLALRQKVLSPQHPDIALSYQKLAAFYASEGKTDQAKEYYEKAFNIQKNFLSNKDFRSISTLHSAAMSEFALGQWKDAEDLLKIVLGLRKESYGAEHPLTAFTLEDLAAVEEADHQKAKAIAHLKEARTVLENVLGADHPEVLRVEKKLTSLSK